MLHAAKGQYSPVQEGLANIRKYAQAASVELRLVVSHPYLILTLRDDGRGFDPATAARAGHGLANMVRRLTEIGGRCDLDSAPGRGTGVTFVVPLPRAPAGVSVS